MRGTGFLVVAFLCLSGGSSTNAADDIKLPDPLQDSDYRSYPEPQIKLGRLLFYDRILSGTYRVSCATCHNPDRATSNGFRSDGRTINKTDEIAVDDVSEYLKLKPSAKHAPTLYNLGANQFKRLFVDGRVAVGATPGTFSTPAQSTLPSGLRDVLAAQALFPIVTGDEQVGTVDNEISDLAHQGDSAIWNALAKRVAQLPEYWPHFQAAFPELERPSDITIAAIANAISAFVGAEWRSDQSPFDIFLRGDKSALTTKQIRGLNLFYGKFKCSLCHAGALQTDHEFHGIAMPIWGLETDPRKVSPSDVHKGRGEITGEQTDMYRYRTPSLRNVAVSAPYGHAGSLVSLEDAVRHHLDPQGSLRAYLAERSGNEDRVKDDVNGLLDANELPPQIASDDEVAAVIAFLRSLTDLASIRGRLDRPVEVPSSLALD